MPKHARYRDSKTGRFVKEETWERSKTKRYKREWYEPPQRDKTKEPRTIAEWENAYEDAIEFEDWEADGGADYFTR